MKTLRDIVSINEDLCNGCGNCVIDCAEGAIVIENGKARVISDNLCDGLGACIKGCPTGALTIIQRVAVPFDEEAVHEHLKAAPPVIAQAAPAPGACLGMSQAMFQAGVQWPIKIGLVPAEAPFLRDADLLIVADCAAAVSPEVQELKKGKVLLLGCPKFEGSAKLAERLRPMLEKAKSCTVVRMEVPCCRGLSQACREAAPEAASDAIKEIVLTRQGGTAQP